MYINLIKQNRQNFDEQMQYVSAALTSLFFESIILTCSIVCFYSYTMDGEES